MCGDAIDDLSDIIGDLKTLMWARHHKFGIEDFNRHFRFLFEIHWADICVNFSCFSTPNASTIMTTI